MRSLPILALSSLVALSAGVAQAQVAPPTVAPPTVAPPTAAPTQPATAAKLKLDLVPELKTVRTKLESNYAAVVMAAKGKTEFRDGVIILLAADRARAAADAPSYKRLATEAATRFDAAKTLATGGTATVAALATLKADLVVGKYVTPAEPIVPAIATLMATPDTWSRQGFEPSSY